MNLGRYVWDGTPQILSRDWWKQWSQKFLLWHIHFCNLHGKRTQSWTVAWRWPCICCHIPFTTSRHHSLISYGPLTTTLLSLSWLWSIKLPATTRQLNHKINLKWDASPTPQTTKSNANTVSLSKLVHHLNNSKKGEENPQALDYKKILRPLRSIQTGTSSKQSQSKARLEPPASDELKQHGNEINDKFLAPTLQWNYSSHPKDAILTLLMSVPQYQCTSSTNSSS